MTEVPKDVFPFEGKFYKFAREEYVGKCNGCALDGEVDCLSNICVETHYIFEETKEPKMSEPTEKVKLKGNKVTIRAGKDSGYVAGVDKLCTVKDNGNGYTVKFHSTSSVRPDIYMNLDYDEADYLRQALNEFAKD